MRLTACALSLHASPEFGGREIVFDPPQSENRLRKSAARFQQIDRELVQKQAHCKDIGAFGHHKRQVQSGIRPMPQMACHGGFVGGVRKTTSAGDVLILMLGLFYNQFIWMRSKPLI